jgi:hypothetical protein
MEVTTTVLHAPAGASTMDGPINVLAPVAALREEMVTNRRWFHAHPELSFQEVKTAARVAELLRAMGIEEVRRRTCCRRRLRRVERARRGWRGVADPDARLVATVTVVPTSHNSHRDYAPPIVPCAGV